jgi:uncharacterized membrane protein
MAIDAKELAVWRQDALPLLYAPSAVLCSSNDPSRTVMNLAWEARAEPAPAVVAAPDCQPTGTASVAWTRKSPSSYAGSLTVHGSGWLVFGQTYDKNWSVTLSSGRVQTLGHVVANGYANAWHFRGSGTVKFTIHQRIQTPVTVGFIAAGALACLCIGAGGFSAWRLLAAKRSRQ